jgi:hypothetical protein
MRAVISHDRWFLDRVATHILAFQGESQVTWFEGSFEEYEQWVRETRGEEALEPHRIKYKPSGRARRCSFRRTRGGTHEGLGQAEEIAEEGRAEDDEGEPQREEEQEEIERLLGPQVGHGEAVPGERSRVREIREQNGDDAPLLAVLGGVGSMAGVLSQGDPADGAEDCRSRLLGPAARA